MTYFVYILKCRDGKLYTGITTDVRRRFSEHLSGKKGAKFTKADPPESIEAVWQCGDRSAATKLECAVKKLTRAQKLRLIAENGDIAEYGAMRVDVSDICK